WGGRLLEGFNPENRIAIAKFLRKKFLNTWEGTNGNPRTRFGRLEGSQEHALTSAAARAKSSPTTACAPRGWRRFPRRGRTGWSVVRICEPHRPCPASKCHRGSAPPNPQYRSEADSFPVVRPCPSGVRLFQSVAPRWTQSERARS